MFYPSNAHRSPFPHGEWQLTSQITRGQLLEKSDTYRKLYEMQFSHTSLIQESSPR